MFTGTTDPSVDLGVMRPQPGTEREGSKQFSIRALVTAHPLSAYFVMAFGFPWLLWGLLLDLSAEGLGVFSFHPPVTLAIVIGPFIGPTLAAFTVTAVLEGRTGVGRLLGRYRQWRVRPALYLFAIFGTLASCMLAVGILYPGAAVQIPQTWPQVFVWYLPALVIMLVISGPLGEEPGWRGFALPRLQARFGALTGSLLLGVAWALWHLPLFLVAQWRGSADLLLYVLGGASLSVILCWLYNSTAGSLLLAMLFHASELATAGFLSRFIPGIPVHAPVTYLAYAACALLVIIATRGRLSYRAGAPSEDQL